MLTSETMEAGKYVLHREFCPLVPLTKSIVRRLEVLGLEKKISFVMRSELPANEKVCFVYFDVPKIEQVFRNLISNSLKVGHKIFSCTTTYSLVIIYYIPNSPLLLYTAIETAIETAFE